MRRLIEIFVILCVSSDFFDQSMASYTCCTPSTASPLMHFGGFLWMHLTLLKRGVTKTTLIYIKIGKKCLSRIVPNILIFYPNILSFFVTDDISDLNVWNHHIIFDSVLFSYSKMNELIFAQQKALFVESESWLSNVNFVFLCNFFRKLKQTARK